MEKVSFEKSRYIFFEKHFKLKRPQREFKSPWSLLYQHLLEDPFHTSLQKVRG
jgi:hypothetical protein